MTHLRVAFQTLGCKLNQLETESVADTFLDVGAELVPSHAPADLYVVNTCTVTSKAEQKARHDIRAALAREPHAIVVATGCYAQMEPAALTALGERVVVISGDLKASLLSLARWLSDNWQGHGDLLHAVLEWQAELRAMHPRWIDSPFIPNILRCIPDRPSKFRLASKRWLIVMRMLQLSDYSLWLPGAQNRFQSKKIFIRRY